VTGVTYSTVVHVACTKTSSSLKNMLRAAVMLVRDTGIEPVAPLTLGSDAAAKLEVIHA
jgi:hypothetical protein